MTMSVIVGNLSYKQEVLLRSEKRLAGVLRKGGHAMIEADVNADLIPRLLRDEGPVVISVPYGGLDEDGALREVLWMLGVPFVDGDGANSRHASNKSVVAQLVEAAGLMIPQQVVLPDDVFWELGTQVVMSTLGERIRLLLIVKPARSGSAFGAAEMDSAGDLPTVLAGAFTYGGDVVAEEFIEDTGLSVTILEDGTGPHVLPPVEIRPASGVYDYESRYTAGATRFLTSGKLPDGVPEAARNSAVHAHRVLGHHDISHTDMIVYEGVPVFLESSVAPGLTDTPLTPLALETVGLDMGKVFSAPVERARRRNHWRGPLFEAD